MNKNEDTYQNLRDAATAVLIKTFIAVNTYFVKKITFQINNLTFYFKILEKEERNKPKARRKEIAAQSGN